MRGDTSTCIHCKKPITHHDGRLWHDSTRVLQQYCWTDPIHGSQLHEPMAIVQNTEDKEPNNHDSANGR